MAFGLDDALMIGSLLVNLGGNLASKPAKRRFNAAKIFAPIKQGILENTEAVTAPIRQSAGESAAARNLTGGAGAQVVAQAEAPVRAAATSDMNRIWGNLKLQEQQADYADRQDERDYWGGLFGDVAGGVASFAAGRIQSRYDDRLLDILSGDGGGTDDIFNATSSARKTVANRPKAFSAQKPKLGMFGNRGAGGFNASSLLPYKRNRLANQYSNPFNPFGMGEYAAE